MYPFAALKDEYRFDLEANFALHIEFSDRDFPDQPIRPIVYMLRLDGDDLRFVFDWIGAEIWNHTGELLDPTDAKQWLLDNVEASVASRISGDSRIMTMHLRCAPFYESEAYDLIVPPGVDKDAARTAFLAPA
jgi:hypothetical protein